MGNFSSAFKQGQQAATSAAIANAEIDGIFQEMANEISSITDGKLTISIKRPSDVQHFILTALTLGGEPSVGPTQDYWICANNPTAENSRWVKIAQFERPYEGYPCRIQFGKINVRCNDRVALASALNEMLTNAWVAHELRDIINRPPKADLDIDNAT